MRSIRMRIQMRLGCQAVDIGLTTCSDRCPVDREHERSSCEKQTYGSTSPGLLEEMGIAWRCPRLSLGPSGGGLGFCDLCLMHFFAAVRHPLMPRSGRKSVWASLKACAGIRPSSKFLTKNAESNVASCDECHGNQHQFVKFVQERGSPRSKHDILRVE